MIGVAIIGLVACLHSEGLSREFAEGSSPTAEPEMIDGKTAPLSTSSPLGDEHSGSFSPDGAEDGALGRSAGAETASVSVVEVTTSPLARSSGSVDEADVGGSVAAPSPGSPGGELALQASRSADEADENGAREPGAGDYNDRDGPRAEASVTPSIPAVREVPGPPTSMATLLGTRRQRLENRLGRGGVAGDDGWVHYGSRLAVRYESHRAVEVALRVPAGFTCVEAARWAGFRRAMPPLYRVGGCAWPGTSARHRIHRGVVGELAQATGILQFWSAKASR